MTSSRTKLKKTKGIKFYNWGADYSQKPSLWTEFAFQMSQTDATPFYLRTMAALNMVIYQAHGLHEGVWGGGANKRPTALFEVFAESGRFGRVTRD